MFSVCLSKHTDWRPNSLCCAQTRQMLCRQMMSDLSLSVQPPAKPRWTNDAILSYAQHTNTTQHNSTPCNYNVRRLKSNMLSCLRGCLFTSGLFFGIARQRFDRDLETKSSCFLLFVCCVQRETSSCARVMYLLLFFCCLLFLFLRRLYVRGVYYRFDCKRA